MASSTPSVEQLVLTELGGRTIDVLRRLDPEVVQELTAALLRDLEVPLDGSPKLNEFAKARAIEQVEAHFDFWDACVTVADRRSGRPRSSPVRDIVLMAAFHKCRRQGLGPTKARREAGRLLGLKTDAIGKGVQRFVKRTVRIRLVAHLTLEEAARIQARFVVAASGLIDKCAEERRAMLLGPRRN